MNTSRRVFVKNALALLSLPVIGNAEDLSNVVIQTFKQETAEERRRRKFVNNTLITHLGREVRFYDDLIKDKTVLINFIYTNCVNEGLCPMMTYNLKKVQELLGERVGKDIFMYSLSLDPEHDRPEVMRKYAEAFKVQSGWEFLTGTREDIEQVRKSLGFSFVDKEIDKDNQEHLGTLKYGIEPLERWGACPALTKPEAIVSYLEWIEPTGQRPGLPS